MPCRQDVLTDEIPSSRMSFLLNCSLSPSYLPSWFRRTRTPRQDGTVPSMDGRIDEWMDGRMDGWMDGSLASSSSFSSPIVHVRKNNRKFITRPSSICGCELVVNIPRRYASRRLIESTGTRIPIGSGRRGKIHLRSEIDAFNDVSNSKGI